MVTTLEKSEAQEWTWSGNGFARQTPSQKQLAASKPLLVYKRARYYDPGTGEFISRDPLGYVDGMSQYRAYFVPGGVDPSGACASGGGYYLTEITPRLRHDEHIKWSDGQGFFGSVIGESGWQDAWTHLIVELPAVSSKCEQQSVGVAAIARGQYFTSLWSLGMSWTSHESYAEAFMTLSCNQDSGEIEITKIDKTILTDKPTYAAALITASLNGNSALVTASAEAGVSGGVEGTAEVEIPKGGSTVTVGSTVSKETGWGNSKTLGRQYTCERCEELTSVDADPVIVPDE